MSTNNSKGLPPLIFTGYHKKLILLASEALQKYQSEKPNKKLFKNLALVRQDGLCVKVSIVSFRENPTQVTRDCFM